MQDLESRIRNELAKEKGVFAVAFKDLSSGREFGINDRDVFHAASTMKTPVMIEVYRQAAAGLFSLDDSIVLKNEFTSIADGSRFSLNPNDDSETELYRHIGEKRSTRELLYQMITVSSNFATNLIIEKVDPRNVMHTMRDLGALDIQVRRGVEDNKAFQQGLNNTTTAHDLAVLFEQIALGKAVSTRASEEMVKVLLEQHFNEIIPAGVGKGARVAHKTGSITGVQHDSGIVYMPDGRKYVLVILSRGLEDEKKSISAMAEVSRMIYDYVDTPSK
jgi:beta-lactamase class A